MKDSAIDDNKPKWLRRLERESWQPELIISGAAIFGSLQLPGLIEQAEQYFLLNYDRDTLFISYIAAIYWRLLASGLVMTFIFHFIVRALWIGLVGLNSVFPGGFRTNERFSQHYQDNMKREYGDVDGLIGKLDRFGSGIFGVAFATAGVFLNFGVIGLLLIFVHNWLIGYGFNPRQVLTLIGILLLPILLLSVVMTISHSKRLRDTALVRRYQWPISLAVSKFTYPLARRYIVTASNLVTSYYADSKSFLGYFLVGMAGIVVIGITSTLSSSNTLFFVDPVYHRLAADSLLLPTSNRGAEAYEGIYVRPVLDTERLPSADGMSVWIPLPEREMMYLEKDCSIPEVDEALPREERRLLRREWLVACAREYISIDLNGRPYADFPLERQYLTNAAGEQYGMRAFLADPPLRKGKNLLRVVTQYPHEETGEPRTAYVSFYHY
ncbi:hypothetical protein GGR28_000701 [Lewinella aquimaris]|uniref:Uncharacterized protein n=1 Tax=Neolewinella aquimaris TaxID=1835722 RepID=A0A840DYX1_9BACT|nr:hypothetical protein [Neolewinella aquimaris]MBB4078100.1 hypothetical protein [Neolewinella aquimaris]